MSKTFEEEFEDYWKQQQPFVSPLIRDAFFAGYMRGHGAAKQQALAQIARSMDPRQDDAPCIGHDC